jgi:hypothetical protein
LRPLPYADLRRSPIALWELTEARKRLRQRRSHDLSEQALFANILEQRRILKEAANSSQQRRRNERIPHSVSIQPEKRETKKSSEPGELKPYPVEIWERE